MEQLSKETAQIREEMQSLGAKLQEKEEQISSQKKIQLYGEMIANKSNKAVPEVSLLTQVLAEKEKLIEKKSEKAL